MRPRLVYTEFERQDIQKKRVVTVNGKRVVTEETVSVMRGTKREAPQSVRVYYPKRYPDNPNSKWVYCPDAYHKRGLPEVEQRREIPALAKDKLNELEGRRREKALLSRERQGKDRR